MEEKAKVQPITVQYCGVCGIPPEYCEFKKKGFKKCREWMKQNAPEVYEKLSADLKDGKNDVKEEEKEPEQKKGQEQEEEKKEDDKKKKKGKKVKNTAQAEGEEITVAVQKRMGKKRITLIMGLLSYGLTLKDVANKCKKRFACSSSVLENKHIEIQGDVAQDVPAFLCKEYKQALKPELFTIKEFEEIKRAPKTHQAKKRLKEKQQEEETDGMPLERKEQRELPPSDEEQEDEE